MHVHVSSGHGEAKYWLEPVIELAKNHGLRAKDLAIIRGLIEENENELHTAWNNHFKS